MIKEDRKKLKNISRHKWTNPNKFNALTAGIALITVLILFYFAQKFIPTFLQWIYNLGVDYGIVMCLSAILSQFLILTVAIVFCKISHVKLFGGGISAKPNFAICIPALSLSLGTLLFITPIHTQFVESLGVFQETIVGANSVDQSASDLEGISILPMLLYMLVLVPLLPAICEEALFRGVIMNGLKDMGMLFAILFSGLAFALMHGSYAQFLLQFILGCEIAFVVLTTNNYFTGMVMHFANNFLSTFYASTIYLAQQSNPTMGSLLFAISILIGLLLIVLAIVYYFKLWKFKNATENEGEGEGKFIFYRKGVNVQPCCLLQKGVALDYCFSVEEEKVQKSDNSNFTFFGGKKFHSFTKPSNKALSCIFLAIGLIIAMTLIILNFFMVG